MNYSFDWIQQQVKQGVEFDYLFFWGHTQKHPGTIDKSCFSQWFPAAFTVSNIVYPTAEHWMMAQKALLFSDTVAYGQILEAVKPGAAKAIGRRIQHFDEARWKEHAYNIVVEGNYYKFSRNEALKTFMMQTGNKIIAEASPVDPVWGIGLAQDNMDAVYPEKWKGTNWLGFALMEVRDRLKV